MKQYDYKMIKVKVKKSFPFSKPSIDLGMIESDLKELGKQGWNLMSSFETTMNGYSQDIVLILKRELE